MVYHLYDFVYACETQWRALAAASSNLQNLHISGEESLRQVYSMYNPDQYTKLKEADNSVNMGNQIVWGLGELEFEAKMRYLDYRVNSINF